jgi:chorismate synthase
VNTFGNIFKLTCSGESHGAALSGIIDGMPAGVHIDLNAVQYQLDRRRPGQSNITTARNEADRVEILSGLLDNVTTGQPIGFIIRNSDSRSGDYDEMMRMYRPSHADYTYSAKYGLRDHRGGGRSSARATAAWVVAGAFARQALAQLGVEIFAYTSQVGSLRLSVPHTEVNPSDIDTNPVRCPDKALAAEMEQLILDVKKDGDTIGGIATGVIKGLPVGLGEPLFGKFQSQLAAAMMSINAAKGFEYGMGFDGVCKRGSEVLDTPYIDSNKRVRTMTNNSGGIQGGITNGEDIYFRVAFKPVATLLRDVKTIDTNGNEATLHARGRHDPCVVPRAVPIVEALAAMVSLDALLLNRCSRL